jgi:hypothetical protein
MKTVIVLVLVAIAVSQLNTATARSAADSAPSGELINYPNCGYPQGSFAWLLCDDFEG